MKVIAPQKIFGMLVLIRIYRNACFYFYNHFQIRIFLEKITELAVVLKTLQDSPLTLNKLYKKCICW